jgi:hypothetical protein
MIDVLSYEYGADSETRLLQVLEQSSEHPVFVALKRHASKARLFSD